MEKEHLSKQDLRVQKTLEAIDSTVKAMIIEMPPEKITIKELTERARIHRKTFYLHYTSIEDLFDHILSEFTEGYYSLMNEISPTASFAEYNTVFFKYMAENPPYYEKILCSTQYSAMAEKYLKQTLKHNRELYNPYSEYTQEEQNVINTFLGLNSINIYRQWVSDGKKLPLEKLIDLSTDLICNGINNIR